MDRLRRWIYISLWTILLIGLSITVLATPVLTLQQAAADPDVWVRFTDKSTTHNRTAGYFGDSVGIRVANLHTYPIRVTARVGDVLIGRGHKKQNLVVTKPLILDVPAGGEVHRDGIYTVCIDAHRGAPEAGSYFDVGPNISEWNNAEADMLIRRLLPRINEEGLWTWGPAQSAAWKLSDNSMQSNVYEARKLLMRAGIDPDQDYRGFPHPSNPDPNTADDTARYFPGQELKVPVRPSSPELAVTLTWEGEADLDLQVTEPSGEVIYSGHPTSGSGGLLDQVSDCSVEAIGVLVGDDVVSFSPMRREHAYWFAPPYGTYTVEINYREACGDGGTATWHVVIEINGDRQEYSGTIGPGMTILVDQFTISSCFIEPTIVVPSTRQ